MRATGLTSGGKGSRQLPRREEGCERGREPSTKTLHLLTSSHAQRQLEVELLIRGYSTGTVGRPSGCTRASKQGQQGRMHGAGCYTDAEGVAWEGQFFNGKYDNGRAFVCLR